MNKVLRYLVIVTVCSGVLGLLLLILSIKLLPGIQMKLVGLFVSCFCLAVAGSGGYVFWYWETIRPKAIEELSK